MGSGGSSWGCCGREDEGARGAALEVVACSHGKDLQGQRGPTSVRVPDGVVILGDGAFRDCRALCAVRLPSSLRHVGEDAFRGCAALRTVSMPETVSKIGGGAFSGCDALGSIDIPASVTEIGDETFSGCKALAFVRMPPFLSRIGNWAFFGCESLVHVDLPQSVAHIGRCAFYGCSGMGSVSIPRAVTVLERGTFAYCRSLVEVHLPDTVVSIGAWAFRDCSSLTSLKLPGSVTSIGHQAFAMCGSLRSMDIPPLTTSIGPGAFASCVSLERVEIPQSVTHIGDGAFIWCASLGSVEAPRSVTSVGVDAFFGCGTGCAAGLPVPARAGQGPALPDAAAKQRPHGVAGPGFRQALAVELSGSFGDATATSAGTTCTSARSEGDLRALEAAPAGAGRRPCASSPDLSAPPRRGLAEAPPAAPAGGEEAERQRARREALRRELRGRRLSEQRGPPPEGCAQGLRDDLQSGVHPLRPSQGHAPAADEGGSRPWRSLKQRLDYRQEMEAARMERADLEGHHLRRRSRRMCALDSEREGLRRELPGQVPCSPARPPEAGRALAARSAPGTPALSGRRPAPAPWLARNSHGVLVVPPVLLRPPTPLTSSARAQKKIAPLPELGGAEGGGAACCGGAPAAQ